MKTPLLPSSRTQEIEEKTLDNIKVALSPPKMILIVGPCRTGTTALANVFARAGLPSFMQPIKSMRRAAEEGRRVVPWYVDREKGDVVLTKETLGPRMEAEFFNPIEVLMEAGFPPDKLHVIGMCREPRATLGSWAHMWGKVPLAGFVESYQLIARVMLGASAHGVKTTYFVQEAIGTADPAVVVQRLVQRVCVSPKSPVSDLVTWEKGPAFGNPFSNIHFFDQPPKKFIKGVREGNNYAYRIITPELSRGQDDAVRMAGLYDIYGEFVRQCEKDLNLSIYESSPDIDSEKS